MTGSALEATKRRLYVISLAVVAPLLPVVGFVQRGREAGAVPAYAVLTAVVVGTLVGMLTRRMRTATAERTIVATISAVVLARVATGVYGAGADPDAVRQLVSETAGPTLVAVVLVVFLAMDTRAALRWSLLLWAAFTAVLVPAMLELATTAPGVAVALGRQSATLLVITGLASGLASLKTQLATERTRASAATELANTDPLTGALNRRGASDVLRSHLDRAHRYHGTVSVALVDLDRFKACNDHLGHAAGDEALVRVVSAVSGDLRASDDLGRWGGDELLVVAPETSSAELHVLADRWRRRIAELAVPAGVDTVTASIGVATSAPGDTVEALLTRADRAMYAAKAAGGDRVVTRLGGQVGAVVSAGPRADAASGGGASGAGVRRGAGATVIDVTERGLAGPSAPDDVIRLSGRG